MSALDLTALEVDYTEILLKECPLAVTKRQLDQAIAVLKPLLVKRKEPAVFLRRIVNALYDDDIDWKKLSVDELQEAVARYLVSKYQNKAQTLRTIVDAIDVRDSLSPAREDRAKPQRGDSPDPVNPAGNAEAVEARGHLPPQSATTQAPGARPPPAEEEEEEEEEDEESEEEPEVRLVRTPMTRGFKQLIHVQDVEKWRQRGDAEQLANALDRYYLRHIPHETWTAEVCDTLAQMAVLWLENPSDHMVMQLAVDVLERSVTFYKKGAEAAEEFGDTLKKETEFSRYAKPAKAANKKKRSGKAKQQGDRSKNKRDEPKAPRPATDNIPFYLYSKLTDEQRQLVKDERKKRK